MHSFTFQLGDTELLLETGKLAKQANGAVVATIGGTSVLATATMSSQIRDIDFFPLMVNYQEKTYAGGMIKSSRFNKREGRPSDQNILTGRIIDRTIRPLFPKGLKNDVQVMLTTLSYDPKHQHDMVAAVAAAAALSISNIPWNGPCASVRVGMINGEFILNPSTDNIKKSDLDLIVSSSQEGVIMIEAGANQVTEEKMLQAIEYGKKWAQKIVTFISQIQDQIGKQKIEFTPPQSDEQLLTWLKDKSLSQLTDCLFGVPGKKERARKRVEIVEQYREQAIEQFGEERVDAHFSTSRDKIWKNLIRHSILNQEKRIAGRKLTEVRPLECEVGLLQRTHGSGLFQRGETQGLSVTTLAGPSNALLVENIEGERKQHYMHHYNFPPYSVGECSNRLFTGNREIGHGALAQRALEPVLPKHEDFPYTIRVVTEILESNGSSSMASVCGSTLSLMDAGVPIAAPVSGIAMGLMTDPETGTFKILSDIQDEEDFGGDMDFKVAGTKDGITAIQMDIKVSSISLEIFEQALAQAKEGRLHIMQAMLGAIPEPRADMSPYAPRLETIKIDTDDIRLVIGKGGETIQKITGETGVEIDINDDGTIIIASADGAAMEAAKGMIKTIVAKPEVGMIYDAKIVKIMDFGAFAEFMPGKQGLIHISLIAQERVNNVNDYVKEGQMVKVKLLEIDKMGRMRLSMKDATQ